MLRYKKKAAKAEDIFFLIKGMTRKCFLVPEQNHIGSPDFLLFGGNVATATEQSGKSKCGPVLGGWVYKQVCLEFLFFEVFLITASVFPLPLYTISPVFEGLSCWRVE